MISDYRPQLLPRWEQRAAEAPLLVAALFLIAAATGLTAVAVSALQPYDAIVWSAVALAVSEAVTSKTGRARAARRAIDEVAHYLGNTPTVCRASYIDPRVIDRYQAAVLRDGDAHPSERAAPIAARNMQLVDQQQQNVELAYGSKTRRHFLETLAQLARGLTRQLQERYFSVVRGSDARCGRGRDRGGPAPATVQGRALRREP